MLSQRLPLVEVIKEIIEKYKNERIKKVISEIGGSLSDYSFTPNTIESVLQVYDTVIKKLEFISERTKRNDPLTELANLWADLEFYLKTTAFEIQKQLDDPKRLKNLVANIPLVSYIMPKKESEHADGLLAAASYINYFHKNNLFPELQTIIANRINALFTVYEKNAQPNDKVLIDLACYGNFTKLIPDEISNLDPDTLAKLSAEEMKKCDEVKESCKRLFPGFSLPILNGRNELIALKDYHFNHMAPFAIQGNFFAYHTVVQKFDEAEMFYLKRFCKTCIFTPEQILKYSFRQASMEMPKEIKVDNVKEEKPSEKNSAEVKEAPVNSNVANTQKAELLKPTFFANQSTHTHKKGKNKPANTEALCFEMR